MFDTAFLDIGIGVAFVFLSLSLVCSGVREGIEQILKTRAKDLERGLRELLEDPDGKGITKLLFNHPQIASLFRGAAYDPGKLVGTTSESDVSTTKTMPLAGRKNLPSYIPATNFSSAIFDLVLRGPAGAESPYPVPPLTIASLKSAATTFSDETVKRVLLSAIDSANDQVEKVRASVEDWFNATMERAAGWYKRRTQLILFVIGVIVAVVLNIDAITIVKRLSTDQTLTAALVAQAKQTTKNDSTATAPVDVGKIKSGLEALGIPMGWVTINGLPYPAPQAGCIADKPAGEEQTWTCQTPPSVWESAQIVVGWLITAFAVMLGAPFWFDVLSKIITIRSTLKPTDEADKKSAEKDSSSQSSPTVGDRPDAIKPPPEESTPPGYEPNAWDMERLDPAGTPGAPPAGAGAAAAPPPAEETDEQRQAREQAGVL